MDVPYGDVTLEFSFPIWRLNNVNKSHRDLLTIEAEDDIVAVPLFTEEKLAKRYISLLGVKKAYRPAILTAASHMILYLEVCETKGANCVTFNPGQGEFADCFSIEDMRTKFANWK